MKGTRNRFCYCVRCCTIDCSKGLSDGAVLLLWERAVGSALCPCLPHACPTPAPPTPAWLPWAADAPKSGQRCAGGDFCSSCPSLPWYTPGKRAINPLSGICVDSLWAPCLHFRIWLQSFRAIWPCTGNKFKITQQPASDWAGFGTSLSSLTACVHSFSGRGKLHCRWGSAGGKSTPFSSHLFI